MEQQSSTLQFLLAHAGLLTCRPRLAVSAPAVHARSTRLAAAYAMPAAAGGTAGPFPTEMAGAPTQILGTKFRIAHL
jgi:hypothetical protein